MRKSGVFLSDDSDDIGAIIEAEKERINGIIVRELCLIGEKLVAHARTLPVPDIIGKERGKIPPHQPNYIDWSSNLRSSIGYRVVYNGITVKKGGFSAIKGGQEGSAAGDRLVELVAKDLDSDFSLVVVAGMEYASYVQAKGYDVLESAELLAERLIENLKTKLSRM